MTTRIPVTHACLAYLCAVTAATFTMAITLGIAVSLAPMGAMLHVMSICWVIIFATAAAPYALGIFIANKHSLGGWRFSVCGGVLTALGGYGLALLTIPRAFACGDAPPAELSAHLEAVLHLTASGAAAGAAAWAYLRRHHPIG